MRRTDVLRALFHAANATWGVLAYHLVVPRALAAAAIGSVAALWSGMELARLRSPALNAQVLAHPFFQRVIRPHEHGRVSGAVFYAWGVALTLALFPQPAAEVGCLVMGFGDPAGVLVGRRFGRTPLAAGRTLEGSAAFVAVAALAALAFRLVAYPGAPVGWTLGLCAAAALAGALAEALSGPVDDNLTVPLVASAAAAAWMAFIPGA